MKTIYYILIGLVVGSALSLTVITFMVPPLQVDQRSVVSGTEEPDVVYVGQNGEFQQQTVITVTENGVIIQNGVTTQHVGVVRQSVEPVGMVTDAKVMILLIMILIICAAFIVVFLI